MFESFHVCCVLMSETQRGDKLNIFWRKILEDTSSIRSKKGNALVSNKCRQRQNKSFFLQQSNHNGLSMIAHVSLSHELFMQVLTIWITITYKLFNNSGRNQSWSWLNIQSDNFKRLEKSLAKYSSTKVVG